MGSPEQLRALERSSYYSVVRALSACGRLETFVSHGARHWQHKPPLHMSHAVTWLALRLGTHTRGRKMRCS